MVVRAGRGGCLWALLLGGGMGRFEVGGGLVGSSGVGGLSLSIISLVWGT